MKIKLYKFTFIYCISILIFQMPPLARPVAVNNISSFFLFASIPVGFLGFILSIKKKDYLFALLNFICAIELFIMIPLVYMISGN